MIKKFDPFTGSFYNSEDYEYSGGYAEEIYNGMIDVYNSLGVDLDSLATSNPPQPNPLTSDVIHDENPDITYMLIVRASWQPYSIFLGVLGLNQPKEGQLAFTENYEPNYLNALMINNPEVLVRAVILYIRQENDLDVLTEFFDNAIPDGGVD